MRRLVQGAAATACLGILLHPFFFVIYRLIAFNTAPRDDYTPLLFWLFGQPDSIPPGSPYGYRILTLLAAVPFYQGLPTILLTNLPSGISESYLRASAAFAALTYVSLIASSITVYFLAIDRAHLGKLDGVCAGVLVFISGWYASIISIDTFAILLICLGLYVIHRQVAFGVLLLVSVACNEKVAIVFVLWLTTRWILCPEDRQAPANAVVHIACRDRALRGDHRDRAVARL